VQLTCDSVIVMTVTVVRLVTNSSSAAPPLLFFCLVLSACSQHVRQSLLPYPHHTRPVSLTRTVNLNFFFLLRANAAHYCGSDWKKQHTLGVVDIQYCFIVVNICVNFILNFSSWLSDLVNGIQPCCSRHTTIRIGTPELISSYGCRTAQRPE
jgi:hypothetical protein